LIIDKVIAIINRYVFGPPYRPAADAATGNTLLPWRESIIRERYIAHFGRNHKVRIVTYNNL